MSPHSSAGWSETSESDSAGWSETSMHQASDLRKHPSVPEVPVSPENPLARARDARAQQEVPDYPALPALEFDSSGPEQTPWDVIESHLISLGRLSPEGVGRRAQPRQCRVCGARTLVGLDDERVALRADAEVQPISALGEMLAHLEGRRTYALARNAGRLVLDYRDAGRIAYRPAGSDAASRIDVLAEHSCRSVTRLPAVPSNLVRQHQLVPSIEGAPCPY